MKSANTRSQEKLDEKSPSLFPLGGILLRFFAAVLAFTVVTFGSGFVLFNFVL